MAGVEFSSARAWQEAGILSPGRRPGWRVTHRSPSVSAGRVSPAPSTRTRGRGQPAAEAEPLGGAIPSQGGALGWELPARILLERPPL